MEVKTISPTRQEFQGQSYYLCGRYFQRKGVRLHRKVWEYYNGPIPIGFHVHHIDGDRTNNKIENLELIPAKKHTQRHHAQGDCNEDIAKAQKAACKWHGSKAGIEWHKKQYQENCKPALLKKVKKQCRNCGKEFIGGIRSLYCSNNCKAAYRRKTGADNTERKCVVCGEIFIVNKYYANKTCSRRCGARLWRKAS